MPTTVPSDHFHDFDQFRKPTGSLGHQVVNGMNESHYALTSWGLQFLHLQPKDTVLDIGCGGGITVERLAALVPQGMVYGADHSMDCVHWASERNQAAIAQGRVKIMQANVENLPFEDASLDQITAIETVYFWPDLPRSFAEVARVLKPGGQFAIIHECYDAKAFHERNQHWQDTYGMHILSPQEADTLLKQAGFSKVDMHLKENDNWMCCTATR